jgi:SAM-dependent methyltransferase
MVPLGRYNSPMGTITATTAGSAPIANAKMAEAWDGDEGEHWAAHAERYERAGRRHWQRFLDRVPIPPSAAVLDVGCGTGEATCDVAGIATSGSVLGVDLSSRMLERARATAAARGLTNVRFERADAQVHPFPEAAFDLAISSFGAMFFADPTAAFANIGRTLRPGGRLALMTWRELARNEWLTAIRAALAVGRSLPEPPTGAPGPFGLAEADRVRGVLGAAGFVDVDLSEMRESMHLGTDAEDAFSFLRNFGIAKGLTSDLDEPTRERALEALHRTLVEHQTDEGVLFDSSVWLIRARIGATST